MKGEVPVCTRCCFCLPLRRGLLAWGYIKICAEAFIIPVMMWYLLFTFAMLPFFYTQKEIMSRFILYFTISFLTVTSFITDFVATIVFIVGGHKKNVKLLRGFYFYSIAMLITTLLLAVASVFEMLYARGLNLHTLESMIMVGSSYFMLLVLQAYFLMLLRSETIKLRNIGDFRFVNNAIEAQCTMTCEEQVAAQMDEKEVEVVLEETVISRESMEKDGTQLVY